MTKTRTYQWTLMNGDCWLDAVIVTLAEPVNDYPPAPEQVRDWIRVPSPGDTITFREVA